MGVEGGVRVHQLPERGVARRHHGCAAGHGLGHRQPVALVEGREHHQGGAAVEVHQGIVGHQAGQQELAVAQAQAAAEDLVVVALQGLEPADQHQLVTAPDPFGKPGEGSDQPLHVLPGLHGAVVDHRAVAQPGEQGPGPGGLLLAVDSWPERLGASRPDDGQAMVGDAEEISDIVGCRPGEGDHVVGGPDQLPPRPVTMPCSRIDQIGLGEELGDEVVDRDHEATAGPRRLPRPDLPYRGGDVEGREGVEHAPGPAPVGIAGELLPAQGRGQSGRGTRSGRTSTWSTSSGTVRSKEVVKSTA